MYADRVESGTQRSVKERLHGNLLLDSSRQRNITGKRKRQDDKWEHDLYEHNEPRISNRKVAGRDLRQKLQKKGLRPGAQPGKSSVPGARDLREKLSGTRTLQPKNHDPPKSKVTAKTSSKSDIVEAPAVHIQKPANPTPKKLSWKADASVDEFLKSLGLEKYLLNFLAEEVDMTALKHMTDKDFKAMGIPMGPRKKILLALESKG